MAACRWPEGSGRQGRKRSQATLDEAKTFKRCSVISRAETKEELHSFLAKSPWCQKKLFEAVVLAYSFLP
ncbi:hypothetical protein EYF80_043747 [Liparis tanakae]|uniref:Uncharacterized protein n=1 Tax=Liparis tanakae TaxID=230148 RepID=A0A4Z2FXM2_9TELE|nr:hypothetical protein EYF80_043747 [Liparis tanakae]